MTFHLIVKMSRFHPKNAYKLDGSFWINIRQFPNNYAKRAYFSPKNGGNCFQKCHFRASKVPLWECESGTFGRSKLNFRKSPPHVFGIKCTFYVSNPLIFRKLFAGALKMIPPSSQSTDLNIQPLSALIFVKKPKTLSEKCQGKWQMEVRKVKPVESVESLISFVLE